MPEIPALTPAELAEYFARIGYAGTGRADLATLTELQAAHQAAIPFENLDVQLGRPPSLDPAAAFDKLVRRRRGGWCYEQNGLFGRVLTTLGYKVTRLSGGVMRDLRGDATLGSHLTLLVQLERDYVADVGFGGGVGAPVPLAEGTYSQPPLPVELSRTADGYWRIGISISATALNYDFHAEPADEQLLARLCHWQGADPESVFVQNLVVQQRSGGEHRMLRGKVLTRTSAAGVEMREIGSADELCSTLRDSFGLDLPEVERLWPAVCERHEALFAAS